MTKKTNKKKKGASTPVKISPERYIRERARKLPRGACYINSDWKENGIAQIVVTRKRADGKFVVGVYLVDTFCMGVKEAFCKSDFDEEQLDGLLKRIATVDNIKEIPYVEAHNIIYGAIEFAGEADIPPIKEFTLAQYVLDEDNDDIPLIEYEFGKDGKYLLVCGPNKRDKLFVKPLKEKLGDKFDYVVPLDEDKVNTLIDLNERNERQRKLMERFPEEDFYYDYPEYPDRLDLKNQFIYDVFSCCDGQPTQEVTEKILSLPPDEAAADIAEIILYEIGRTYMAVNDETIYETEEENRALMHSVIFLSHIDSNVALDAVLELFCQNREFFDYHFGDFGIPLPPMALMMAGKNDVERIMTYLYEPGHDSLVRSLALDSLGAIARNYPEKHDEIINKIRELMVSLPERVPERRGCDGYFAGCVMSLLMDLNAKELLPEVKALFDAECVNPTIAGDYEEVARELNDPDSIFINMYTLLPIDEQYEKVFQNDPVS